MKPLRLTLQAFGPYLEKQELDFADLSRKGLFLVHGKTGAGKSSILDSMIFCLYGKSSVEDKTRGSFRSQFATMDLITEVEFEFLLGGRIYRVRRSLEESRKRNGETDIKESVSLMARPLEAGEEAWEQIGSGRLGDTSKAIEDILGLDAKQFQKVVVLPQGRFRDLLIAGSAEKEKILGNLFGTERFNRIIESAKELKKQAESLLGEMQAAKKGTLMGLNVPEDTMLGPRLLELEAQLAALKDREAQLKSDHEVALGRLNAARRIKEDFLEYDRQKARLGTLALALPRILEQEQRLARAQSVRELAIYLSQESSLIQECEQMHRELTETGRNLENLRHGLPLAMANLDEARTGLMAFGLREAPEKDVLRRVEEDLKLRERSRILRNETEKAKENLKAELGQISSELGKLDLLMAGQAKAQTRHAQETLYLTELRSLFARLKPIDQASKDLAQELELALEQKALWRKEANTHHSVQEELKVSQDTLSQWDKSAQEQAVHALSLKLLTDCPCPVCGSRTHPEPATRIPGSFVPEPEDHAALRTQVATMTQELARARAAMDHAQKAMSTQEERCAALRGRIETEGLEWAKHANELLLSFPRELVPENLLPDWDILAKGSIQAPDEQTRAILTKLGLGLRSSTEAYQEIPTAALDRDAIDTRLKQKTEELHRHEWEGEQAGLDFAAASARLDQAGISTETGLAEAQDTLSQERSRLENLVETSRLALEEKKRSLLVLEARFQNLETSIGEREALAREHSLRVDNDLARLGIPDRQSAQTWIIPLEEQSSLQEEVRAYRDELNLVESNHRVLQDKLQNQTEPDLFLIQDELDHASSELRRLGQEIGVVAEKCTATKSALEKIAILEAAMEKHLVHLEDLTRIAEVMGGNNQAKVSLQRYALSVYLDEVLMEANGRFTSMTEGRYQLRRMEEVLDGRKGVGLDLEVLDEYTGMSRPVQSLSGGESFMAALSLALGLSAVVQANAGGANLDTLFVDEGFGSLDEDALQGAIGILERLGQSGRCLGIISHVKELQERISTRVYIDKGRQGSFIQVE